MVGSAEEGRNSMLELAGLADQTFQRRSNILQRLLEPIGLSCLDDSQVRYPVCRRISRNLDQRKTEIAQGRIDKEKSEVGKVSTRKVREQKDPTFRYIIGNGSNQRPPTLLVTLLRQKEDICISP